MLRITVTQNNKGNRRNTSDLVVWRNAASLLSLESVHDILDSLAR